jgi:hypothetical protein
MRAVLALVLSAVLVGLPTESWADSSPVLPPPTLEIPFDDDDPAVMQAEVGRQVLTFLQSVQTRLGQSQEVLRRSIDGSIERDEHGTLVYARRLSDHTVLEGYNFLDGGLVRGQYLCLQRPVNGLNEFIDYYAAVKQSLIALYGTPAQDQLLWENELYQPLPDYWGVAVQIGHLRYAARWETPDGTISIELTGNHHSRLAIEYRSKDFIEDARTT